ncbi:hypothetical protein FPSE_07799, partial [Fusarium pseudograminearum CS3096]
KKIYLIRIKVDNIVRGLNCSKGAIREKRLKELLIK